jgi:hypothetical protein
MRDLGLIYRGITPKRRQMGIPVKPVTAAAAPDPKPQYELAGPNVIVAGVRRELLQFVDYLALIHRVVFSKPLVITSGKDSVHVASSLHGQGLAVDFRTKDLLPDEQQVLLMLLAYAAPSNHVAVFDERALGGEAHIHLEYHGS